MDALARLALVAALALGQVDAPASGEPVVPRYQTRSMLPSMLRLRLDTESASLHVGDAMIPLAFASDRPWRATNFAQSGPAAVLVAGYERDSGHGLLVRASELFAPKPRLEVAYRGETLRRPIALAVGWPTQDGVVVVDDHEHALWSFDPTSKKLLRLADARSAPSLAVATDVRILEHSAGEGRRPGYEIRVCSVTDDLLTIPHISKPSWVFLHDGDGDGVIDSVQDAPWAGAK